MVLFVINLLQCIQWCLNRRYDLSCHGRLVFNAAITIIDCHCTPFQTKSKCWYFYFWSFNVSTPNQRQRALKQPQNRIKYRSGRELLKTTKLLDLFQRLFCVYRTKVAQPTFTWSRRRSHYVNISIDSKALHLSYHVYTLCIPYRKRSVMQEVRWHDWAQKKTVSIVRVNLKLERV